MKLRSLIIVFVLTYVSCANNEEAERKALMEAIEAYETAWSNGDF